MSPEGSGTRSGRQRAFFFDQAGCIGCSTCQIACKDLHDLPVGVNWLRVTSHEAGHFPRPIVFHQLIVCGHCEKPACVKACPVGAIAKRVEDGLVLLDASLCNGCLACLGACPYDALQLDEATGRVGKCDLCADLLGSGKDAMCVSSCMMRVLSVGWLDEREEGEMPTGPGLPDPALTRPALRVLGGQWRRGSWIS